jgi:putative DNA primase/helicase
MIPAEIIIATSIGRKVFPVEVLGKTPLVKWRSFEPASSELEQINKWFIRYGPTNWGLATGHESGIFVVDIDSKEGYDWVVANGLTDTYSVKTGGSTPEKLSYGYHFYFKHPGAHIAIKNSAKDLSPGVDVRGDGGYVLIPPSMTEMAYYVANPREIAVAPQWLIDRVTKVEVAPEFIGATELSDHDYDHGMNILKAECKAYANVANGEWNYELNKLCFLFGRMVAAGVISREDAEVMINDCPNVQIYRKEQRNTVPAVIRSGINSGLAKPWVPLGPEDVGFAGGIPSPEPASIGLRNMAGVTLKPIRWLWPSWLPLGKLVIYAGPGGVGKSSVTFSWASTISKGGKWPDGTQCKKGRVLIWSGEDDIEDTIAPRLKAMGADMSNIDVIQTAHGQAFDPARDFAQLKVQFKPGEISLLIIDPIVSAVSGDMNKANEVRRGLQAIVDFAGDLDCCVIGITHFTKQSAGKSPTERVTGSQAFTAFARMTLVGQKDEDTSDCVIARAKSNISVDSGGLKYRIEPTNVQNGIETTRVHWLEGVEGGARDILSDLEPGDEKVSSHKVEQAKEFLEIALSKEPRPVTRLVSESGFSLTTLKRAKKLLAIRSTRDGSEWLWSMPFDDRPS